MEFPKKSESFGDLMQWFIVDLPIKHGDLPPRLSVSTPGEATAEVHQRRQSMPRRRSNEAWLYRVTHGPMMTQPGWVNCIEVPGLVIYGFSQDIWYLNMVNYGKIWSGYKWYPLVK